MTAHNLPIWKLMIVLNEMMDQGFVKVDLSIEDDLTLMMKGIKELPPEQNEENKQKDIDWENTI